MAKGKFYEKVEKLLGTIVTFEQDIKILEGEEQTLSTEAEDEKKQTIKDIKSEIKTVKELSEHTQKEIQELENIWSEFINKLNKITIEGADKKYIKKALETYNHANKNVIRMHNTVASMTNITKQFKNNNDRTNERVLKIIQGYLFELSKDCLWYTGMALKYRMVWRGAKGLGQAVYLLIVEYFSTK